VRETFEQEPAMPQVMCIKEVRAGGLTLLVDTVC